MIVELSERQSELLTQFAHLQREGSPDNLCTKQPIFVVQKKVQLAAPKGYGHRIYGYNGWHGSDFAQEKTPDSVIERFGIEPEATLAQALESGELKVNGQTIDIYDEEGYFKALGATVEENEVYITWKNMAFFLTLEEAKRYKNGYQKHNCHDCRIFGFGLGYDNRGDLPEFYSILMQMGNVIINNALK
jgi:hypothetical protein